MKYVIYVFMAATAVMGSGCAVSPPQAPVPQASPATAPGDTSANTPATNPAPEGEIPPAALYRLLVADVAVQRGQLGVAIANYLAAAEDLRDARIAERATRVALYARAPQPALKAARLWVELDPEGAEAHRTLAALLLGLGRVPETVAQYERFIALSAGLPDHGFQQIAVQLSQEQNHAAAKEVMEQLLAKRQDDPSAWLAQAWLSMRQGELEQAMTSVDRVRSMKPDWVRAVLLRARVMALRGDKQGALGYLQGLLEGELAEDLDVRFSYARLLTELNQPEKALAEFDILAERAPDNAEVRYAAGVLAIQLQRLDEAKTHLQYVLQLGQRILEANYFLGRVYELQGDKEQALQHYLAVRHGEYRLNAQARAASLLAEAGELDRARELLNSLRVDNEQERVRLYLLEGELLRNAGQTQAAFDFYSEKLEQLPDATALRYSRALLAEQLDKLELAEQDLRDILALEPENAQALNALGYTLADRTDRYQEALGYIQRAMAVEPDDAAVIDSMGWVQYRLGHYPQAVDYLRRALTLAKDPEIAAHLGEVLWVMGDRQGAIAVWEEYVEQFPQSESLQKVMRRFGL